MSYHCDCKQWIQLGFVTISGKTSTIQNKCTLKLLCSVEKFSPKICLKYSHDNSLVKHLKKYKCTHCSEQNTFKNVYLIYIYEMESVCVLITWEWLTGFR